MYDHVHQEQIFAGVITENIVEIPVVQEQVIAQALPEVVDSLPPVEEFTGPGFNQVHHEQNPAIPVVIEYFPMTDDEGCELSAGVRPAPLEEWRPQGKLQRHAGIGYELVLALDAPVLQMVEQLPDVHHLFATCLPVVAEQEIDMPKIILETIPSRHKRRETQLAEQLVEVPTIVSYSSLQQKKEHNVDIPVPGGGGRRGRKRCTRLWPKLVRRPGQGSTAFHGAEHLELLGLQGFPQDKVPLRLVEQNFKVYPQDRVLLRFVEHNFKIFQQDRAPQCLVEHIMDFSQDRAQQHLVELNIFIIFLLLCLLMERAVVLMARQSSGPCVSACSSVLARASRGTSARLHMHGKSSILTLLSGACRKGIHRQRRAVYKYWATLRCGSLWTCLWPCTTSSSSLRRFTVEGTSGSVHRQSVGFFSCFTETGLTVQTVQLL